MRTLPLLIIITFIAHPFLTADPPQIENVQGFLTLVNPRSENLADALAGADSHSEGGQGDNAISIPSDLRSEGWYRAEYYYQKQSVIVLLSEESADAGTELAWRQVPGLCPGRLLRIAESGQIVYAALNAGDLSLIIVTRDRDGIICEFLDQFIPLLQFFYREFGSPGPHFPAVIGTLP